MYNFFNNILLKIEIQRLRVVIMELRTVVETVLLVLYL